MPKPCISEAVIFEGARYGAGPADVDQQAILAMGGTIQAKREAEDRALALNRFLRDRLGYWINDGVVLELTDSSDLPYGLTIASKSKLRDRAEIAHTEVRVAPGHNEHLAAFLLDTTDPSDRDPAASLVVVDPATGREYPAVTLEPSEQLGLSHVVGRLDTDIQRELTEEHFRVQPLL